MTSSASSSAAPATIAQKAEQENHRDARSEDSDDDASSKHHFSVYYVNTHLRHAGYVHPTHSSQPTLSSHATSDGALSPQANLHSSTESDDDDDDIIDDEQGAQWEEWSCEQKNEWVEKEVRELVPCMRANYVLPTADRFNSQGDSSVFEGYAGIAMMYFHSFYKIVSALPSQQKSSSASPSSARLTAEHHLHVQRQWAIAMLQEALDYIVYTLSLITKQTEDAADPSSNMSEEDRATILTSQKRCSFIRSKAGAFALAALIWHHRARYLILHPVTTPNISSAHFDPAACLKERRECVEKLLEMGSLARGVEEDEFFNGKAGYLYALNLVHSHFTAEIERMDAGEKEGGVGGGRDGIAGDIGGTAGGGDSDRKLVDNRDDTKAQPSPSEEKKLMDTSGLSSLLDTVKEEISAIHNLIITRGQSVSALAPLIRLVKGNNDASVLTYKWHGKEYYGAAHGTVGILHQLLQSPPSILQPTLPHILSTADHLLSLRFPSGNFPSSADSTSDRLVQFCHGAPGLSLLCSRLYAVTRDQKWLNAAVEAAEVVWRRGLLKKGVGLCHGIGGNGYVFLALYEQTQDEVHLRRAYHFVHFALSQHRDRLFSQPDQPFSLYNGQAGFVCFAVDMEQSKTEGVTSSFPGYELMNCRESLREK